MAQNSNKVLETRHIKEPTEEILRYIDNRRKGIIKSLQTKWPKFNRNCMGGIEPNTIYSIVGISGSGNIAVFMRNYKDNNRAKTVKAETLIPC
jgi:hypothetical protein